MTDPAAEHAPHPECLHAVLDHLTAAARRHQHNADTAARSRTLARYAHTSQAKADALLTAVGEVRGMLRGRT